MRVSPFPLSNERRHWYRGLASSVCAATLFWSAGMVLADDGALVGTWKLKSFVRQVQGTGEQYDQLGDHPDGYISYSSDGRMSVIMVARDRVKPLGDTPNDEEAIKLHRSMIAYAGTYTVEPGKVVHHIDIAWSGTRIGSDQERFFALKGNVLTLKTAPNKSPVDGKAGVGILVFEKVQAPTR